MKDGARHMYKLLATLFLAIGGGFALVAVVQAVSGAKILNGNALGPALLVLIIGILLAWTVRGLPTAEEVASDDGAPPSPSHTAAASPDGRTPLGRGAGGGAEPDEPSHDLDHEPSHDPSHDPSGHRR